MSAATMLADQQHHPDALAWAERVGEDTDGYHRELVYGGVVVTPPPTHRHQRISYLVAKDLEGFFSADHWVLQGAGLLLRADTLVEPDVMVVGDPGGDRLASTPDQVLVAVEILSPSNRTYDLKIKAALYGESGVNLWVVDPVAQSVTCYENGRPARLFQGEQGIEDPTGVTIDGPVSRYFA
jgi:Uma2 family endonuclease